MPTRGPDPLRIALLSVPNPLTDRALRIEPRTES